LVARSYKEEEVSGGKEKGRRKRRKGRRRKKRGKEGE